MEELLVEIEENIEKIKGYNQIANYDNTIKVLLRPKVKSTLEHLRSCLDYMLHDIDDYYAKENNDLPREKIYFPYKPSKKDFQNYMKKDFPNLNIQNYTLYKIIEHTQVHKCKDNWMHDLCKLTNDNKHDNLLEQNRVDDAQVNIGNGAILLKNCDNVIINNSSFNGQVMKNFRMKNNSIETDRPDLVDYINWANFTFLKSGKNIIELLEKSYSNVFDLKNQIYVELCKK